MNFTWNQALLIALVLFVINAIDKTLSAGTLLILVVFLVLASFVPIIAVPIGLIGILWSLYRSPQIWPWLASITHPST